MEHGSYVIRGEFADRYRAVGVALLDLKIANGMIARCIDDRDDDDDDDLEEALWTTALIRFRRAFTKGRGADWGYSDLLSALTPERRASFDLFYMFADKFIAHPVGIGEDMAVTAEIGPGVDGSAVVYGGCVREARVSSPGTDLAKELLILLAELIDLVAMREGIVHREFIEAIRLWWSSADLLRDGMYESSINFDRTSGLYRKELKKYGVG